MTGCSARARGRDVTRHKSPYFNPERIQTQRLGRALTRSTAFGSKRDPQVSSGQYLRSHGKHGPRRNSAVVVR